MTLVSTPLATLYPQYSAESKINFDNALNLDIQSFLTSIKSNMGFDQSERYQQNMRPVIDSAEQTLNKLGISTIIPRENKKIPFSERFNNSFFGKNQDKIIQTADLANTMFTSFAGEKSEYSGEKGDVTRGIDTAYDSISDFAQNFGPVGTVVSQVMAYNKLLGNVANKLGAGTDAMTNTDAILGSSFLQLTPFGLINGFGGKRANTITKNDELFAQMGTSYSGSESKVDDALTKSGKKYGLFSSGARNDANREINEAKRQQDMIEDISDVATTRRYLQQYMSSINGNRTAFNMQGGYNQANVRVGKSGMSLDLIAKAKKVLHESKKLKEGRQITPTEILLVVPEFQEGGQINKKDNSIIYARQRFPILKSIEVNLQYDPNFRPREIGNFGDIEYMTSEHDDLPYYRNYKKEDQFKGKPTIVYNDNVDNEDIALDMLSHGLREQDENWKSYFLPNLENDWKQYIIDELFTSTLPISLDKFKNLSDKDKQRYFRQFDDNFKLGKYNEQYNSILDGLVRALSVKDEFRQSKGYNYPQDILNNLRNTNAWKQAYDYINSNLLPEIIVKHQEGGSINIIPEGALHARKHNMDMEGITPKGIPVVSNKEGGEVEQQAEIEREEIIFRLEVTKKLEELEKKYYDDETSQKEKDECALEAGKLLVEEILYNTQDNTNSLL